jgi:acetylglutamate kinase
MEVVEMVLSGLANKALAAGLTAAGVLAAGISCRDAGLVTARLEPNLGRVGLPETVRPALVQALWAAGIVPVVSPVASTEDGASVNVNADEAALGLARSLGASSLVYLSDVDGVRIGEAAVSSLTAREAEARIADGTIAGGMVLKVRVALEAARSIPQVVIAGRARLEGRFAGTTITAEEVRS